MLHFNLKNILDDRDISVNKLSKETGISRPSVTAMYNNTSNSVNLEFLEKIMEYLNVELTDVIKDFSNKVSITFIKTKKEPVFCNMVAFHNDDKIFDGEIGLIPNQYLLNLKTSLQDKKKLEANNLLDFSYEDFYIFYAEPTHLFSLKTEDTEKFQTNNVRLKFLFLILGAQNINRLILRFLVEILEMSSTKDREEYMFVKTPIKETFMYSIDGKTVIPLTTSKEKVIDEKPPYMKINIKTSPKN